MVVDQVHIAGGIRLRHTGKSSAGFKGEQNLAQLIRHRGWRPLGVVIRI
jgi:hypothetical protein